MTHAYNYQANKTRKNEFETGECLKNKFPLLHFKKLCYNNQVVLTKKNKIKNDNFI